MRNFQTAFDFVNGVYRLNNARVPWTVIDGYHTRTSGRRAEFIGGRSQEYANGVMALTDRGYDSREGWTVLNANPLNPSAWSVVSGAVVSDEPGEFLGFASARRVASAGAVFHRITTGIAGGIVSGQTYRVRALYKPVSSLRFRLGIRSTVDSGRLANLAGLAGDLVQSSFTTGTFTNIVNKNLGGGLFEIEATFTATETTAATLDAGPESSTEGDAVIVIAAQITQTSYSMPFGVGTVAPDSLVIPAAGAGLAVNPSATGLTIVWRGRAFTSAATFAGLVEVGTPAGQFMLQYRKDQNFRFDLVSGGTTVTRAMAGALDQERTFLASWRPDGTCRCIGLGEQYTVTRAAINETANNLGIGRRANSAGSTNAQTLLAAVGAFALTDPEAEVLFNQVAAA